MNISKSKLKAHLLEYLRTMEATGEAIIITDRNRPVGKITPYQERRGVDEVFAAWRGRVRYHEDVLSDTSGEWAEY